MLLLVSMKHFSTFLCFYPSNSGAFFGVRACVHVVCICVVVMVVWQYIFDYLANFAVQSVAFLNAPDLSFVHCSAASLLSGSSGFGSDSKA